MLPLPIVPLISLVPIKTKYINLSLEGASTGNQCLYNVSILWLNKESNSNDILFNQISSENFYNYLHPLSSILSCNRKIPGKISLFFTAMNFKFFLKKTNKFIIMNNPEKYLIFMKLHIILTIFHGSRHFGLYKESKLRGTRL